MRERFVDRPSAGLAFLGVPLLLSALVCLFFWKILFFPNEFHIPHDLIGYHYPLTHEIFVGLKRGHLPLWDPYAYAGMPLAGNMQAQLFYPPTLLAVWLSKWIYGALPYRVVEYLQAFHCLLAGLFAYLLARRLNLSRAAAIMVSIIYPFGGFFASRMLSLGNIGGATWIPLIFYFLKRSWDTGRLIYATGAGFSLALVILAGFPPFIIVAVIMMILSGLIIFGFKMQERSWRPAFFALSTVGLTLLCGIGLAAVQLAPAWELIGQSTAPQRYKFIGLSALRPESYMTLLLPSIFSWDPSMPYLYIGTAPLALAALCALYPNKREAFFILALTVFSFFWSLGDALPISPAVWLVAPRMIKGAIYCFSAKAFFDLGIALLAGFGLESLNKADANHSVNIRRLVVLIAALALIFITISLFQYGNILALDPGKPERSRLIAMTQALHLGIIMLLLAGGALYWRLRGLLSHSGVAWLLIAVTAIDLFTFNSTTRLNAYELNPDAYLTPDSINGQTDILDLIRRDPDYQRGGFLRVDSVATDGFWGTASRLWRLENANGNDPMLLKRVSDFRLHFSDAPNSREFIIKNPASRLLDLLGVKYLLIPQEVSPLRLPARFQLVMDRPIRVYLNSEWLPRALLVPRAVEAEDMNAVFHHLTSPTFSPRDYIVVEKNQLPAAPEPYSPSRAGGLPGQGSAQITSFKPNTIVLTVESSAHAFLLLGEIFYPGWNAYVDGRRQNIIQANGIFRSVRIPPGRHQVLFKYEPLSLRIGAVISALTLLLIGWAWLLKTRANKDGPSDGRL